MALQMYKISKSMDYNTSQCSSLVAHWLLVPGDHGSNPSGGEKCALFRF